MWPSSIALSGLAYMLRSVGNWAPVAHVHDALTPWMSFLTLRDHAELGRAEVACARGNGFRSPRHGFTPALQVGHELIDTAQARFDLSTLPPPTPKRRWFSTPYAEPGWMRVR